MRKLIQFLFMSKSERIKKAKYKNIIESKDGHDNCLALKNATDEQKKEHIKIILEFGNAYHAAWAIEFATTQEQCNALSEMALNSGIGWVNDIAMRYGTVEQKEAHRKRGEELDYEFISKKIFNAHNLEHEEILKSGGAMDNAKAMGSGTKEQKEAHSNRVIELRCANLAT